MKVRLLIVVAAVACVLLFTAGARAHGDEQHVIGTVSKISHDSLTVRTIGKDLVEVMITSETKFTKGDDSATLKDVQVGERVVIHAMPMKGGMLMANNVQIGVTKNVPKAH